MRSLKFGNKKAQVKLSFGMIFSIILIIAFLSFGFYAISKFLGLQKTLQAGTLVNDLQNAIDKMWKGGQGSQEYNLAVPSKTQAVCFTDFEGAKKGPKESIYNELGQVFYETENLVFYPIGSTEGLDAASIEHINITKITAKENPYCIVASKSRIKMVVKMSPGDSLVTIERGI